MEFVARGPILDLRSDACEPLPEPVCRSYMRDIVNGLRYRKRPHGSLQRPNIALGQFTSTTSPIATSSLRTCYCLTALRCRPVALSRFVFDRDDSWRRPNASAQIADFGVSLLFEGDNDFVKATAGSVAFMAPEMCARTLAVSARLYHAESAQPIPSCIVPRRRMSGAPA